MWFIYPQLRGLGRSEVSQHYGIAGLAEAKAYLAHPVLGPRLHEAAHAALGAPEPLTAEDVFGPIDALKLRSSMTLFHRADPTVSVFAAVLDRFFASQADSATLTLLDREGAGD